MTTPAIEIKNLCFAYKDKPILKGIDLSILPGQIIGYIGPMAPVNQRRSRSCWDY